MTAGAAAAGSTSAGFCFCESSPSLLGLAGSALALVLAGAFDRSASSLSSSSTIAFACGTSGESGATITNFWYVARATFRSPRRRWHCAMLIKKPGSGFAS